MSDRWGITTMRIHIRALLISFALAAVAAPRAHAQLPSRHGQAKQAFSLAEFGKLRWLEGDWAGTSATESPIYTRYKFTNDSTIDISYFRDQGFSQPMGEARVYLSVGRVFQTFGPNRWGATHVSDDGVYFVPQASIRSYLEWKPDSPDTWTSTQRSGVGGHETITVYHMKRVR
jgi:hypothetical protein